jgi:acyl-CoA thioester hydrolase
MSKIFTHPIVVQADDIDALGHVNNVVYVRWVQEVAAAHWESVAPSDFLTRYSWVVLRHEIDYRNPAFMNDELTGQTWVGEHYGAKFDRFVKITRRGDEKIIGEARTTWCLLDSATLRPQRIPNNVLSLL